MAADQQMMEARRARDALASAAAMRAAAERRGAWPAWFSLAVAAAFGVNGVILALGQTWAHKLPASAVVLALMGLGLWLRRSRGAALRSDMRRIGGACIINIVFILFSSLPRGPLAFGGAGPFLYGAAQMAAILTVFAIIGLMERQRAEPGQ